MRSVKPHPLQFALREMQGLARQPRVWLGLAAIGVLMGLVGPFETFELPLGPRLAYWTVVVISTGALGTLVTLVVTSLLPDTIPSSVGAGLGGLIAGAPIGLLVWGINNLAFGPQDEGMSLNALIAYCIPLAGLLTTMGYLLGRVIAAADSVQAAPMPTPVLLERLPLPQRGRLLHLAVNDHYVDVTTDRGTTLVLLRLSDAIRETAPVPGLQVHRSHWVALAAVRRTARQSGKPVVELENGTVVPISRTFMDAARTAGLVS